MCGFWTEMEEKQQAQARAAAKSKAAKKGWETRRYKAQAKKIAKAMSPKVAPLLA